MMGEVVAMGGAEINRAAAKAFARLREGEDSMLSRAARIAKDCPARGDIGMLTPDGYPPCGRVMVPTAVLADLVLIATARGFKP